MEFDVNFIRDFILETIEAMKPAEIKTLIYRNGGVEISPGNIAKAIVPERLQTELNDGDAVVVGRFTGQTKYLIMEKSG